MTRQTWRPTCDGTTTDLGRVQIHKGTKLDLGSCNFCNNNDYKVVYQLGGARTQVRLCPKCLEVVKKCLP